MIGPEQRDELVAVFSRIEAERGGYALVDADEVLVAAAAELGLDEDEARDTMVRHWAGMQG